MSQFGPVIPLDANAAYISITQLMGPNFHWSLYLTDAEGTATRYHWRENTRRSSLNDPIEFFEYSKIDPVTQTTRGYNLNLAFVKITAFTAPVGATPAYYASLFESIFPTSYTNVKENRDNGTRCRTWLMGALERLRAAGFINLSSSEIAAFEGRVIEIGTAVERGISGPEDVHTELTSF